MAEEQKSDMVMMFVLKGDPVSAECALDKIPDDDLMKEFTPATYEDYSNFFEVTGFELGVEVKDDEAAKGNLTQASSHGNAQAQKPANSKVKGGFLSWRSANTKEQLKKIDYAVEVETFSFKRVIDAASPIFFQKCCETATFDRAILVKRVSIGSTGGRRSLLDINVNLGPLNISIGGVSGGSRPPQAFLRIEFTKVLITGINWDDGDVMTENCTFICQNFKISYKQQNEDGSLSAVVSPAEWDRIKDARRNTANPPANG